MIGLIDTSVLDNLLAVPKWCQDQERALAELQAYSDQGVQLLLPLAAIYESGNHIAQATGDHRAAAERFVVLVRKAVDGEAPFRLAELHDEADIKGWLGSFVERATQRIGMADLSIIHLWERLRSQARGRRVFIWSYDGDLAGYDTDER